MYTPRSNVRFCKFEFEIEFISNQHKSIDTDQKHNTIAEIIHDTILNEGDVEKTAPVIAVDVVSSMGVSIATSTDMAERLAHDKPRNHASGTQLIQTN